MTMMPDPLPNGSIYRWMYVQGLRGVNIQDVVNLCKMYNREIRDKDIENFYNGHYKHNLYSSNMGEDSPWVVSSMAVPVSVDFTDMKLDEFPENPFIECPEPSERWVPCDRNNKPMIRWSKSMMSLQDAKSWPGSLWVGENLKGTQRIVIDCDGDHTSQLDYEAIAFFQKYAKLTHCLSKPKTIAEYEGKHPYPMWDMPASFHLTFWTDRIIPTKHFKNVDIIGNKENSLRYCKNKQWNGVDATNLDPEIWDDIMSFLRNRQQ